MSKEGFNNFTRGLLTTASLFGFSAGAHAATGPADICGDNGVHAAKAGDPVRFSAITSEDEQRAVLVVTHNGKDVNCIVSRDELVSAAETKPERIETKYGVIETTGGSIDWTKRPEGWFKSYGDAYEAKAGTLPIDQNDKRPPSEVFPELRVYTNAAGELKKAADALHGAKERDLHVEEEAINAYMAQQGRPKLTPEVLRELEKLNGKKPGSLDNKAAPPPAKTSKAPKTGATQREVDDYVAEKGRPPLTPEILTKLETLSHMEPGTLSNKASSSAYATPPGQYADVQKKITDYVNEGRGPEGLKDIMSELERLNQKQQGNVGNNVSAPVGNPTMSAAPVQSMAGAPLGVVTVKYSNGEESLHMDGLALKTDAKKPGQLVMTYSAGDISTAPSDVKQTLVDSAHELCGLRRGQPPVAKFVEVGPLDPIAVTKFCVAAKNYTFP